MKLKRACLLVLATIVVHGCSSNSGSDDEPIDPVYRDYMRDFVIGISDYAKTIHPGFIVIPQNGPELITTDGNEDGSADKSYLAAIDGVGREDLFYGYDFDDVATPDNKLQYMLSFMDIAEANNVQVLTTDYCSTASFVDESYRQNTAKGYVSFAADHRELDNIPDYPAVPVNMNSKDVASLADVKNFLYILNPGNYANKSDFLAAIQATDYDAVIIDLFYDGTDPLTFVDINSLKTKSGGGSRLIIAYMSIGEAEDYRYYWDTLWQSSPPPWLAEENPDWPGNYKVRYWDPSWQNIIYGNETSYLKMILDAGFDGVYLDIIDSFEYFE